MIAPARVRTMSIAINMAGPHRQAPRLAIGRLPPVKAPDGRLAAFQNVNTPNTWSRAPTTCSRTAMMSMDPANSAIHRLTTD